VVAIIHQEVQLAAAAVMEFLVVVVLTIILQALKQIRVAMVVLV
jgi:hypothetical protein